jgi:hypothetical protein
MMTNQGHMVDSVLLADVPSYPFYTRDVVIIGSDTGYNAPWGPPGATAAVTASGLPVIGLGAGGFTFLEDVGNYIGTHGFGSSGHSIDVTDPGHEVWSTPIPITIPPDHRLQLYTMSVGVRLVWMGDSPPWSVTCMGYSPEWPQHCALTFEYWSSRFMVHWGYGWGPDEMTDEARALVSNLLHYVSLSEPIFADGFESEDTAAWSATVP